MNLKLLSTAAVAALLAFFLGNKLAADRPAPAPVRVTVESPEQAKLVASLQSDNAALKAELARLKGDLERVDAANTTLMAQRAASPVPAAVSSPTIGVPLYQLQREVLNNLRQIDAARKQYQIENQKIAGSVRDLVGVKAYIKTVRTVGGENYGEIPMDPAQPMTVTTPDGVSVTFDPAGVNTTKIEVPPEVARVQELSAKVLKPSTAALAAYRSANGGKMPPSEEAVVPFFTNPNEAAEFMEFVKAKRAAGL